MRLQLGRRRRRTRRRWRGGYGARERTGDGANERGGLGGPICSLGLKRSDSSRKKSTRKIKNSVLEINSKTSSIRAKIRNLLLRFLRGKIEEDVGIKTPKKTEEKEAGLGWDLGDKAARRARLGSAWPAAGGRRCYRHVGPTCQ